MTVPNAITDLESLKELCGEPNPHTPYKIQEKLTEQAKNFLRQSPFMLLSTVSPEGELTISPKGGDLGFVVLNEAANTLYLLDVKGNNLIFSVQNMLLNPKVGLIFFWNGRNPAGSRSSAAQR